MGTRTSIAERMAVVLSTFLFVKLVVGKLWDTEGKQGDADGRSDGVPVMH